MDAQPFSPGPAPAAPQPAEQLRLRDGRLHDARHTAATVLLVLSVPDRAVMGLMGWSSASMAKRYQHITHQVRQDVAKRVDGLIWKPPKKQKKRKPKNTWPGEASGEQVASAR